MKSFAAELLPSKYAEIHDLWLKQQLKDEGLRSDLMSQDDLRRDSESLLKALTEAIRQDNFTNSKAPEFDRVNEILAGVSLSRAANGFSHRESVECGVSLREA